jgi:hypothetical protein
LAAVRCEHPRRSRSRLANLAPEGVDQPELRDFAHVVLEVHEQLGEPRGIVPDVQPTDQRGPVGIRSSPTDSGHGSGWVRWIKMATRDETDSNTAVAGYGSAIDMAVKIPTLSGALFALAAGTLVWAWRQLRRRRAN